MSQANVKLMARGLEAINARDEDAIATLITDEMEWRPALTAGGHLERTVYRGRRGMLEYLDDLDRAFDEWSFQVEEIEAVGEDRVLYRGRFAARGRRSGVPLDSRIWGVWRIENGRFMLGTGFLTEAEALQAAGLSGG